MHGLSTSQFDRLRGLVAAIDAEHRHTATYMRQRAREAGIPADYPDVRAACRAEGVTPVDLNQEGLWFDSWLKRHPGKGF